MNHDKKYGQYNYIKQTASSEVKSCHVIVTFNIPFKMHMFMLSRDPTLGFMQCVDHLKLLKYFLRIGRNADGRIPILISSKL